MKFEDLKNYAEFASYLATIIGIPVAIVVYIRDKRAERKAQSRESLFTSHALFADFLKICMENLELNIYDITYNNTEISQNEKKELLAFEILFAYLETAFHYYQDQPKIIKAKRWSGWEGYIAGYATQENFRRAWKLSAEQWDTDFVVFIDQFIKTAEQNILIKSNTL